jgi:signal transduction histidine kinase
MWHVAAWAQAELARQPVRPAQPHWQALPEPRSEPRGLFTPAVPVDRVNETATNGTTVTGTVVTRQEDAVSRPRHEDSWDQSEVFDYLARRLQSLVHREIGLLDELENEVEDPELLKSIFRVDHLATRVRRYAENIAVLGGGVSDRMWTRPVSVNDVLRSAVAEIEQYRRVKLVPPVPGMLHGHAVVDVVHLLAELAENATVFSAPQTQVYLRAEFVTAGLVVEVEDRGLGMAPAERNRMNALLASRDRTVPDDLVRDGRIGMYVVASLARQHGIAVQLKSNIFGGTQALLVLPHDLLADPPATAEPEAPRVEPAERAPVPVGPVTGVQERPPAQAPRQYAPVENPPARSRSDRDEAGTAAVAQPVPRAEVPAESARPSLPVRNPQGHLPSELRAPTRSAGRLEEVEHSPGLMAAFQSGVRQAEDAPEPGASAGPTTYTP